MRPYNDTSSIHFVNEDVNKISSRKHEAFCAPLKSKKMSIEELQEKTEKALLEAKRLRHQNWLKINEATGRDRIQFTHKHVPEINFRMQLYQLHSKAIDEKTMYFVNIYQN